jgi:hypothetical protein
MLMDSLRGRVFLDFDRPENMRLRERSTLWLRSGLIMDSG